jgi:hypothetical protein
MTNEGNGEDRQYEESASGTETKRKDDPLKEYRDKEPMTPAKEHEPTAVKRDPSDQSIVEPGETGRNRKQAHETARSKGMAKDSDSGDGDEFTL